MEPTQSMRAPRLVPRQLAEELRDHLVHEFIVSGKAPAGELLPSETWLAAHYGVSRVTIRAALRMLQDAHMIRIRNGIGSVVMPRPAAVSEGLDQLVSLETYMRERSQEVTTVDLEWSEDPADEEIAEKLELAVGSPLYTAHRVKVLGGVRVAWGIERVPADVLPLQVIQDEFAGSVMDVLLAHSELRIDYADAELVPAPAPAVIARRLHVRPGTVCQTLEQVMYAGGWPLQWGKAWLLPQHYRLRVRRRVTSASPRVG